MRLTNGKPYKTITDTALAIMSNQLIFYITDRTCPDDCTDSSQGTCDISTGTCSCEQGFDGNNCAGKKTGCFLYLINHIQQCLLEMP